MREKDLGAGMVYVRSLRDAIKRRFAVAYLGWIRAGRVGLAPTRGALAPALAKAVSENLDGLE